MNRSLIFIQWHDDEARELAAPLEAAGWTVKYGLPAKLSAVRAEPPHVMAISLRRLPSHGREVADALWSTNWGREIPIVFFDGEAEKVQALKELFPKAKFIKYAKLQAALEKYC